MNNSNVVFYPSLHAQAPLHFSMKSAAKNKKPLADFRAELGKGVQLSLATPGPCGWEGWGSRVRGEGPGGATGSWGCSRDFLVPCERRFGYVKTSWAKSSLRGGLVLAAVPGPWAPAEPFSMERDAGSVVQYFFFSF